MRLGLLEWLQGSGDYSVAVPAMDGALKPNGLIDDAERVVDATAPDNLVVHEGAAHFSSLSDILRLGARSPHWDVETVASFESPITCLASDGADGLAVGLDAGGIVIKGGRFGGTVIDRVGDRPIVCPTAVAFENDRTLLVCLGSQTNSAAQWKRDLFEQSASGSVWRLDLATSESALLRDAMAFPYGIAHTSQGGLLVCESWRHRVVALGGKAMTVVVDELPAYPARIAATGRGDYLLSAFAPRRQMVEFILREPKFKARMINEIPDRYWMAPALSSGKDFLEPLQGGQIRHHGVLKAWAPTKSYGLVIRVDEAGRFKGSMHSRTGRDRHGITSAIEHNGWILMTSKGGDQVVAMQDGGQ